MRNFLRNVKHNILHSVPRTHWTTYMEVASGKLIFTIWKQWLNKTYRVESFEIKNDQLLLEHQNILARCS